MKSPMLLWTELAEELGQWCRVCTTRDIETVSRRVEKEGISFLTLSLPSFCVDFERSLAEGSVDHVAFAGFRRDKGLPRFLGGFLDRIFDRRTGVLLQDVSADAVFAVRQLTRLYSKVLLPCSDERERKAFAQYLEVESELEKSQHEWTPAGVLEFSRMARLLFGRVFSDMDFLCATGNLVPKHGPGATADKLIGNEKLTQTEWPWRLEENGFYAVDYLLPNSRYHTHLERVRFLDPGEERPVRVIQVPKTLKTPRIIAIEPTCMQYTQQALARPLMKLLEENNISKRFIGFSDQVPNQVLARKGSVDGSLATLDLSEASDRVSNRLVKILLHGYTHFSEMVQASRSLTADVPGHGNIPLTKFASMGSALCFPIESLVFTTLVFVGIQRSLNHRLSLRDIQSFSGSVRVYGDDIIVPAQHAESVSETLEAFGFKVNSRKSFWTGLFRESCGKDYYKGIDVTPVKVRRVIPTSRDDVEELVSLVSFRNQLHERGFVTTVKALDTYLGKVLKYFPVVSPESPLLGRHGIDITVDALCPRLHKPLARGYVVKTRLPVNPVDDIYALLKIFLREGDLPVEDNNHLERSGRPSGVTLKLTMASPL